MSRAVVLRIPDGIDADEVARLIAAALVLNGYRCDAPAVIDWPEELEAEAMEATGAR